MHSSVWARTHGGRSGRWFAALVALGVAAWLSLAPVAYADHGAFRGDLGRYTQRNLVSDIPGAAELTDSSLVNAWGLSFGPTTPAWVANNGTDSSTLYSGAVGNTPVVKVPLTVSIPGGAPTGTVFNGGTGFVVHSGTSSGPARFLFSSEAGIISGWSAAVPPPPTSTAAQIAVTVPGAIFKGLAIADTGGAGPRLYATDFHNAQVDVWDQNFNQITTPGAFQDPAIPRGFAPFGIQAVNGTIVVTYAKQDADAEDDVAGAGLGFVDAYSTSGVLLRRFAARGPLNAPWGIALAPFGFGGASGALLIGNFGDGRINAYDPVSGRFLGQLQGDRHKPITIDGLWALEFGNGVIGTQQTLLFTAGPDDESHGLFGELTPAPGHDGSPFD
jgi:uncharacterized protein (TIGR03118 family)